jgi:hypothetical protein
VNVTVAAADVDVAYLAAPPENRLDACVGHVPEYTNDALVSSCF